RAIQFCSIRETGQDHLEPAQSRSRAARKGFGFGPLQLTTGTCPVSYNVYRKKSAARIERFAMAQMTEFNSLRRACQVSARAIRPARHQPNKLSEAPQ